VTWPRISDVAFDATSRLIPGKYTEQPEHALADLAADEAALNGLIRLAGATNPRLQAQEERHPQGISRAELVFHTPFSKIVNASFAYPGQGARFHSAASGRGAWYCALKVETAIAEVAFHRVRMLAEIGRRDEADIPYRQFVADIHGQDFAWLDDHSRRTRACLDPDSYRAGQDLGAMLVEREMGGVVYPAVRDPRGTNLAVLQPSLVGNVRAGALYRLTIEDGRLASLT